MGSGRESEGGWASWEWVGGKESSCHFSRLAMDIDRCLVGRRSWPADFPIPSILNDSQPLLPSLAPFSFSPHTRVGLFLQLKLHGSMQNLHSSMVSVDRFGCYSLALAEPAIRVLCFLLLPKQRSGFILNGGLFFLSLFFICIYRVFEMRKKKHFWIKQCCWAWWFFDVVGPRGVHFFCKRISLYAIVRTT